MNKKIKLAMQQIALLDADVYIDYHLYKDCDFDDIKPKFEQYYRYKIMLTNAVNLPSIEYSSVVLTEDELIAHLLNAKKRLEKDIEMSKSLEREE